jgi:hypothetical protein
MQASPCGCEMLRAAADEPSPEKRLALELDGATAQLAWGCPHATGRTPDAACLGPTEHAVLGAVESLTGFRGATTCPLWHAAQPWVHRAARAYRWRKSPLLAAIEPEPSAALVDAVERVENGVLARQAYDAEKQRERWESDRAKREQG